MENASKALIMAAGVLLGVMILSIGVVLFNSFGGFSQGITNRLEESRVSEFNNNFLKFTGDVEVIAHDIITMANNAKQSNVYNEIQDATGYSQSSLYIEMRVVLRNSTINNFEKRDEEYYTTFIENNIFVEGTTDIKYFECTNIIASEETGRVIYIEMREKR